MVRPASHGARRSEGEGADERDVASPFTEPIRITGCEGASATSDSVVPPFLEPYTPRFDAVRRVLGRHEGFVLLPVEVPSVDLGRALAVYLDKSTSGVRIVEPKPEEWGRLPSLLLSLPAEDGRAVVLLGPRERKRDLSRGLNQLNLKRDTLARHLGRPR